MTAKQITIALWNKYSGSSSILIPRYTPPKWWECDMWRLTKAGYAEEFEIKISLSDFKADAFKSIDLWTPRTNEAGTRTRETVLKHKELVAGRGPNRFWFVMPKELADKCDIPPFAGLLTCALYDERVSEPQIIKSAPLLNRNKPTLNIERTLWTFYWRFWTHETRRKNEPIESFKADETTCPLVNLSTNS